jgi:chromate transporter
MSGAEQPRAPASLGELFLAFSALALKGFGGVLPWAQRAIVEEKRWLSNEEFVELLAFGQLLPGPNVCNLAIMVGDRFFGWRGALAALAGMLGMPAVIVIAMAWGYGQLAAHPLARGAVAGMGAVSAGLIIAMAFRLGATLKRWPAGLALSAAAFVLVGVLRWPLPPVLIGLSGLAILIAWRGRGA